MKTAHISMTPVAGAAWAWSEAFKEAGFDSFCIARKQYNDGRHYPSDEDYPPDEQAIGRLRQADLIFCHQGHPYRQTWYPQEHPTVGIYHSQPKHTSRRLEADGWPWAVVGQYQTRLYPGSIPVPNLVPLNHPWYQLGEKSAERIRIAYSPSNRNLPGWDDKGHRQTVDILRKIVAESDGPGDGARVDADVIEGVSLEECLKRKAAAHIVIDEVVTGSYHRSSIEGLALGCIVINAGDGLCAGNVRQMTGGCSAPFTYATLESLCSVLQRLVEHLPCKLAQLGAYNRHWMERCWSPAEMIERNLHPLMDAALARLGITPSSAT